MAESGDARDGCVALAAKHGQGAVPDHRADRDDEVDVAEPEELREQLRAVENNKHLLEKKRDQQRCKAEHKQMRVNHTELGEAVLGEVIELCQLAVVHA